MSIYLFPRVQAAFLAALILMRAWTFDHLTEGDLRRRSFDRSDSVVVNTVGTSSRTRDGKWVMIHNGWLQS
jgi:hypothetical protein